MLEPLATQVIQVQVEQEVMRVILAMLAIQVIEETAELRVQRVMLAIQEIVDQVVRRVRPETQVQEARQVRAAILVILARLVTLAVAVVVRLGVRQLRQVHILVVAAAVEQEHLAVPVVPAR